MSEEHDPEIIAAFFDEVDIHLESLNQGLLQLEAHYKSGQKDPELIASLFRAFHSIKGASGMLGFFRVNKLTHRAETLLDYIRQGKLELSQIRLQALFESIDGLQKLLSELKGQAQNLDLEQLIKTIETATSENTGEGIEAKQSAAVAEASPKTPPVPSPVVTNSPEKKLESDSKYLKIFLDESSDALQSLEQGMLEIDTCAKEKREVSAEILNEIFRKAHQVKASAAAMGYSDLSRMMHILENVFDLCRAKKLQLSEGHVTLLFHFVDRMKECVQEISTGSGAGSIPEVELLCAALADISPGISAPTAETKAAPVQESTPAPLSAASQGPEEAVLAVYRSKGIPVWHVRLNAKKAGQMAGMRLFNSVNRALTLGDWIQGTCNVDDLTTHDIFEIEFWISLDGDQALLRQALVVDQVEIILLEETGVKPSPAASASVVSQAAVEGGSVPSTKKGEEHSASVGSPPPAAGAPAGAAAPAQQTIRVDVDRLDHLMNLSGELVVNRARFSQISNDFRIFLEIRNLVSKIREIAEGLKRAQLGSRIPEGLIPEVASELETVYKQLLLIDKGKTIFAHFQEAVHQLNLVSNNIQDAVMDIRMVPVGPMFGRFKRVVRDICKELSKEVELVLLGEDTEMDKKMIDELGDPLTHMVRNAADHGVETPEVRVAAGKPPQGTITLNAFQSGNRICITVQDDGKGIDPEVLKKKALEKGLFPKEVLEAMSQKELTRLIFHAGFSTAKQVTNISGRGVGMDIVLKKIEELNGFVEVESVVGKGSIFTLSLPLTLATQQCLLTEIGATTFALPLDAVKEIVRVPLDQVRLAQGEELVQLRNQVIPVRNIEHIFPTANKRYASIRESERKANGTVTMVVLNTGQNFLGLEVDRLIGEQELVIKSLNRNLWDVPGISGVSILGNGAVAIIVDIEGAVKKMVNQSSARETEAAANSPVSMSQKSDKSEISAA